MCGTVGTRLPIICLYVKYSDFWRCFLCLCFYFEMLEPKLDSTKAVGPKFDHGSVSWCQRVLQQTAAAFRAVREQFGWFAGVGCRVPRCQLALPQFEPVSASASFEEEAINYTERKLISLFEMDITHDCTPFHCWRESVGAVCAGEHLHLYRHKPPPLHEKLAFHTGACLFLFLSTKMEISMFF